MLQIIIIDIWLIHIWTVWCRIKENKFAWCDYHWCFKLDNCRIITHSLTHNHKVQQHFWIFSECKQILYKFASNLAHYQWFLQNNLDKKEIMQWQFYLLEILLALGSLTSFCVVQTFPCSSAIMDRECTKIKLIERMEPTNFYIWFMPWNGVSISAKRIIACGTEKQLKKCSFFQCY